MAISRTPLLGISAVVFLILGLVAPALAAAPTEPVLLSPTANAQGIDDLEVREAD